MAIMVKDDSGYISHDSDLYDIFEFFNFRVAGNNASASYGTITLEDSGASSAYPTSGNWVNTEGESGNITPFTGFFNIAEDGYLENVSNYDVNYYESWPNYTKTTFTVSGESTPRDQPPQYNISGKWRVTQTVSSRTCQDHIGYDDGIYEYNITQNGENITITAKDGSIIKGIMNGSTLITRRQLWIVNGIPYNEVGTLNFSSSSQATGYVIATWTDGSRSCQARGQLSAVKISGGDTDSGGGGGGGGCFISLSEESIQGLPIISFIFAISLLAILFSIASKRMNR